MEIPVGKKETTIPDHSAYYSENGFWEKVGKYALAAGKQAIRLALILYYTLEDPEGKVPLWAKSTIYGALAYFIFPLDAIPDLIPVAGFTDDIAVMAGALAAIGLNIPPEARTRADEKLNEWFE
jgi:uncharacterized membrane protein YkvA (DUF1232 family)